MEKGTVGSREKHLGNDNPSQNANWGHTNDPAAYWDIPHTEVVREGTLDYNTLDGSNTQRVLAAIKRRLGVEVNVISGDEEAELDFCATLKRFGEGRKQAQSPPPVLFPSRNAQSL